MYATHGSSRTPGLAPNRLLTDMELSDRVVLITGGKRIGAALATELARGGADVALAYRTSRTEAEETADAIRVLGRRTAVLQADLAEPQAAERVSEPAWARRPAWRRA